MMTDTMIRISLLRLLLLLSILAFTCQGSAGRKGPKKLLIRRIPSGGDSSNPSQQPSSQQPSSQQPSSSSPHHRRRRRRRRQTFDVIRNVLHESYEGESMELRKLMQKRAQEYLDNNNSDNSNNNNKLAANNNDNDNDGTIVKKRIMKPPLKILHQLAPKIPAILHSPDYMLRIQTARSDIDAGVAASLISVMARLTMKYEYCNSNSSSKSSSSESSFKSQLVKDRRFEQLVECVVCGVNVSKRKLQAAELAGRDIVKDFEEIDQELAVKIDEGLDVHDACRAAWGLCMLGVRQDDVYGGQKVSDILTALSLRIRDLLIARLQRLAGTSSLSLESAVDEDYDQKATDLAGEVASAIWTFACVKASTGLRTTPLFETCSSILCQSPAQLKETFADLGDDEVVDRLAKSEEPKDDDDDDDDDDNTDDTTAMPLEPEECDALLHKLSPNEVCDVMWAIALHGRTDDTGSKQEINLSDTASALSEIAFDRIAEWLREDLLGASHPQEQPEKDGPVDLMIASAKSINQDFEEIQVVDAAALLASETSQQASEVQIETETVVASIAGATPRAEEIEVVDAATLLASQIGDLQSELETEVVVTSTTSLTQDMGSVVLDQERDNSSPVEAVHYSNHELCSIAWAVTDLHDSLRSVLVMLIVDILHEQGKECTKRSYGGDLSNLAWAIARWTSSEDFKPSNDVCAKVMDLLNWIVERSLELVEGRRGGEVLASFQAPEIGRLMWSLAMTLSNMSQYAEIPNETREDARAFAMIALSVADTHSPVFDTEDLGRVTWGFLELSKLSDDLKDSRVAASLGRIVVMMETSILQWESGSPKVASTPVDEPVRFASFLGRPRLYLKLLEQRVDAGGDDEEELSTHLPLLRDLSMDPATMCKLAYGLSRANEIDNNIVGAWTFTRISSRLMASKDGQLLKVSSGGDDIRLAYACAASTFTGYGKELVTRQYARRFVQRINEKTHISTATTLTSQLSISPRDTPRLIWSLGQLGVRHWKKSENGAYKKLRVAFNSTLLSEDEAAHLTTTDIARLVHGAVCLDMLSSAPEDIMDILDFLKVRSDFEIIDTHTLCELSESLARVKSRIAEVDDAMKNSTVTDSDLGESQDSVSSVILSSIRSLHHLISNSAILRLDSMSDTEITRLVLVYATLPFKSDEFIDAAEAEVLERLEPAPKVEGATDQSFDAHESEETPELESETTRRKSSTFSALRKALKNLVFPNKKSSPSGDHHDSPEPEAEAVVPVVDDYTVSSSRSHNPSTFELSRCLHLIAAYRRVDFEAGTRATRHDSEKRQEIGRNVITRILDESNFNN